MTMRYKVDYHSIPGYSHNRKEMAEWCNQCVGPLWINWKFKDWKWYFRYKKDYAMFLLRWK
jgi:hypothetical protein